MQNAHATAALHVRRDLERRQSDEWYECDGCDAQYQSENARDLCCSHGTHGGDGK